MELFYSSLNSTSSIFIIMLLGYFLSKYKLLKIQFSDILSQYVFLVALPIEIFLNCLNKSYFYDNAIISYLVCYTCGIAILWIIIFVIYRLILEKSVSETGLNFIAIGQTNTGFLAIPIFLLLFGNIRLIIPIILFQSAILTTISLIFIDMQFKLSPKRFLDIIIKNPLILSAIIGIIFSFSKVSVLTENDNFLNNALQLVAQTTTPMALIALGASFHEKKEDKLNGHDKYEITLGILLKNIIHPCIAFFLGKYLFNLNNTLLMAVSIISAMPSPKNTFILAEAYNISSKKFNVILLLTTIVSFFIINFIYLAFHF